MTLPRKCNTVQLGVYDWLYCACVRMLCNMGFTVQLFTMLGGMVLAGVCKLNLQSWLCLLCWYLVKDVQGQTESQGTRVQTRRSIADKSHVCYAPRCL